MTKPGTLDPETEVRPDQRGLTRDAGSESAGWSRFCWLAIPLVAVTLQCADGARRPTLEQEGEILGVVVDSLPFAMARWWGVEGDRSYTALLDTEASVTRMSDQLTGMAEAPELAESHPQAWIDEQIAKEHVVGSCSTGPDGQFCDLSLATLLARVSRARLLDDDRATVEVSLSNRGFAAVYEVTLERGSGAWAATEFDLLVIS